MNERFSTILWWFAVASVITWAVMLKLTLPAPALGAVLISEKEVSSPISLRDQIAGQGIASGVLVNNSAYPVRDVELLIRDSWEWVNEFRPGMVSNNPGRAIYYTVPGKILPGNSLSFNYRPATPLPARPDGRFATSVDVVGFTEVHSKKVRVSKTK